jgi:hypothetical protein
VPAVASGQSEDEQEEDEPGHGEWRGVNRLHVLDLE